ncbi:hypothetical protein ABPG72_009077 [Tetrahymena utriculariae]
MSFKQVSNVLHEEGLNCYKQPTSQFITNQQKEERLKFAHKYRKWKQKWKNCLFSDESILFRGEVGNKFVWLYNRDELQSNQCKQKVKYPTRVHVWGMISYEGGVFLKKIDGKLNSETYIEILSEAFENFDQNELNNYMFQQDLASCHTSKKTLNWLSEQNIELLEWMPKGADFSPIEKCWSFIKDELDKLYDQNDQYTDDELFKAIESIFFSKKLSNSITKMYQSLHRNVEKIIEKNGDQINL